MNSEIPQSVKKRSICSLRPLAGWRRGLWHAAGANERIAGPITKRRAAVITLMLAVCVGPWGCAVYGVVTAESASRISAVENEVKSAVVALNVQATLRDHVLRTARDRSSLNFVALDDRGPTAVGEPIDYQALASEGVDTVVEVSVPRIRLAGTDGINPPVGLFMTARVRVIRTADGAELYAETFEYGGGSTYKFLEWAAEGG